MLVLGDSLLKFSGVVCRERGYAVHCFPGIKTDELRHKVEQMDLKKYEPEIVAIHVGTNSIRKGVTAEEIMGDMLDLVDKIRLEVKDVKIVISSLLRRSDINVRRVTRINSELDWLCSVRQCTMVDGNCWLYDNDFARDGIHLNRRGSFKLGELLSNAIESAKQGSIIDIHHGAEDGSPRGPWAPESEAGDAGREQRAACGWRCGHQCGGTEGTGAQDRWC